MGQMDKTDSKSMARSGAVSGAELGELIQRKSGRRRRWLIVPIVLLAVAGAAVVVVPHVMRDEAEQSAGAYKTAPVVRGHLLNTVTATGTLEALNTVEVGAEISGQVETIHVDFNDTVKKDELLAELDREQYEAALGEAKARVQVAEASVTQALATVDEANKSVERTRELAGKGLSSQKELETAEATAMRARAALDSARANAALARASRDAARSRLEKTTIRSPIDGVVLSREVEIGQAVNAGMQTPVLFIIAEDLRKMVLSVLVDEADIGAVRPGQNAVFTVDAYPEKQFKSTVNGVRNIAQIDQNVVSYETRLDVENTELLLKPGMTATADITTKEYRDVLLVPNAALRFAPPTGESPHFRGPPLPLLGGRGKSSKESKRSSLGERGKLDARHVQLWTLRDGQPQPFRVVKIATDGISTAVSGDGVDEGMEVIVESQSAPQGRP